MEIAARDSDNGSEAGSQLFWSEILGSSTGYAIGVLSANWKVRPSTSWHLRPSSTTGMSNFDKQYL